jgi:hypothetical protein
VGESTLDPRRNQSRKDSGRMKVFNNSSDSLDSNKRPSPVAHKLPSSKRWRSGERVAVLGKTTQEATYLTPSSIWFIEFPPPRVELPPWGGRSNSIAIAVAIS